MVAADRDARFRFEHERAPEHSGSFTLDRHIRRARREMGEAKWQQLNREWND